MLVDFSFIKIKNKRCERKYIQIQSKSSSLFNKNVITFIQRLLFLLSENEIPTSFNIKRLFAASHSMKFKIFIRAEELLHNSVSKP